MLYSGLLVGRRKKSRISRDFQRQIRGKNGRFRGNFRGQFHWKTIGKERPISWVLPKQISLECDWSFADLRKVFNETRRSYRFTVAHFSASEFGFQVSSHSVFVVRIRNGLFVYLVRTSMNFAHFAGFHALSFVDRIHRSEKDRHLCR